MCTATPAHDMHRKLPDVNIDGSNHQPGNRDSVTIIRRKLLVASHEDLIAGDSRLHLKEGKIFRTSMPYTLNTTMVDGRFADQVIGGPKLTNKWSPPTRSSPSFLQAWTGVLRSEMPDFGTASCSLPLAPRKP